MTFTGTTNAAEPMLSPVSRRACVWWSWSLQERYRGSASSEPRWHERAGATSGSWFDLTDAGMRVQVDPRGATVTATNTTLAAHELGGLTVRQLAQASQGEVRFVRRHELPARQPIAQLDGDWRLLETIIGPGEDVWACGTAGQVPPPDDGTLHGRLHGGVISAALDTVGGFAATVGIGEKFSSETAAQVVSRFGRLGTIDLRVDYLRQGTGTRFMATGRVTRLGGRIASVQMTLKNETGLLIATGCGSYVIS